MTCIVNPTRYPTKTSLKEAITKGVDVSIDDPSFVNPRTFSVQTMELGERVVVTNHPKRSYFLTIEKRVDGTVKVY